MDGPCAGLQYVNLDSGRVLFGIDADSKNCVYRISVDETRSTVAGSHPVAYFDRFEPPTQ